MNRLLVIIFIFLAILVIREKCMKKEGYADQVIHGVVGDIAGPRLDPSLYVYEKGRRPAPTYLSSLPPDTRNSCSDYQTDNRSDYRADDSSDYQPGCSGVYDGNYQ